MVDLAQAAADVAAQTPQGDEVVWSAVTAWATAKLIEYGKSKPWIPLLGTDDGAARANRIVSWVVAAGLSLGLVFTFDGDHFMLSGSVTDIMSGLAHAIRQVMFQEIAYKKFIQKVTP